MEKSLLIFIFTTTTPFTIVFFSAINYYWDYAENMFTNEASSEVYDFIVVFQTRFGGNEMSVGIIHDCLVLRAKVGLGSRTVRIVKGCCWRKVGAGSSGTVVAHRLSKHYKVLLLEAGGDPIFLNSIPALALDLLGYKAHDWNYKSLPQTDNALSNRNQQFAYSSGKVMGGSSTINYMLYLRGNPLDYENWANITGDPEWKYDNVLPYFKKSIKEYKGNFSENSECSYKHKGSSIYLRLPTRI